MFSNRIGDLGSFGRERFRNALERDESEEAFRRILAGIDGCRPSHALKTSARPILFAPPRNNSPVEVIPGKSDAGGPASG
jgi:hypothetical protein